MKAMKVAAAANEAKSHADDWTTQSITTKIPRDHQLILALEISLKDIERHGSTKPPLLVSADDSFTAMSLKTLLQVMLMLSCREATHIAITVRTLLQ